MRYSVPTFSLEASGTRLSCLTNLGVEQAFYGEYCTVKPLLLKWRSLTADHIKRIMRISEGDNQLYVASMLSLLRGYQRAGMMPSFQQVMGRNASRLV